MHRRLFSIGLAVAALVALAALVVTRGPAAADASASSPVYVPASLPTPSPAFSTFWMSVVTVDRSGRHTAVAAKSITADVAGDTRVTGTWDVSGSASETSVYDAATHTMTSALDRGEGDITYYRSLDAVSDSPLDAAAGAAVVVRAALAEKDPTLRVKAVTFLGRPAWSATRTRQGLRTTTVVDRATGLPLRYALVSIRHPRTERSTWRVVDLKVDVPVDASTFTLDIPAGAAVEQGESYEHFAPLGELAARVGYAPLVPAALPDGSQLAAASTQPDPWGPYTALFPVPVPWTDLSKLPDRMTTLYYQRGFDRFTVREWSLPGGIGMSAPAALDKRPPDFFRKVTLTAGTFAGRTARTWFNGNGSNGVGLYVQSRSRAVLVTGDLTRSDALTLAGSLQE
jgi:hypothetical protein